MIWFITKREHYKSSMKLWGIINRLVGIIERMDTRIKELEARK